MSQKPLVFYSRTPPNVTATTVSALQKFRGLGAVVNIFLGCAHIVLFQIFDRFDVFLYVFGFS